MTTRTRPSNYPDTGGTDFRVDASDEASRDFADSIWRRDALSEDTRRFHERRVVEVQAFRPSTSGGGISPRPVVTIALHLTEGMADVMLSAAEAREVAIALITSAAEADGMAR